MSSFQDKDGRDWTLDINIDAVEVVKSGTGVSLYELTQDEARPLSELLENPPVLAHVCYILAGAEAKGVDQRTFAKAIKGPQFEAMANAFLEELTLFFPPARQRALTKLIEVGKSLQGKAMEKMEAINNEALADKLLTQILSNTSGSLRGLSASTPVL